MNILEFLQSHKYLPKELRDFHDQKDLFKVMHRLYGGEFDNNGEKVSWVTGQCYVIDWFLWFMASRGFTLQRCRSKVDFLELQDDVQNMKNEQAKLFKEYLNANSNCSNQTG